MISVCMAVYNGSLFLEEQLNSILSQLSENDEVIISDDDSTDSSCAVIENIKDYRIRLLRNKIRLGPVYNLERALIKAKGDLIFLADQDDIWLQGKVKICSARLNNIMLVLHDANIFNGKKRIPPTLFVRRNVRIGIFRNLLKNSYTGCCIAFKRDLLEKALPFPKNLPMHDQWLGLCAERYGSVEFISKALIDYRSHLKNYTMTANGGKKSVVRRFIWRLNLLIAVILRFWH